MSPPLHGRQVTLSKEYFLNKEKPILKEEMYNDVYGALNKILYDQNLSEKFTKMEKVIEESQNSLMSGDVLEPQFLLRLHCVAVCYDKSTMKILIMKRSGSRKKYPDQWEFGCAKGTLEKSLSEQIEQEYFDDFKLKIKVVCDENRDDKQPIPLALYEIKSDQGKDKGFISLAEIIEPYRADSFEANNKHSRVRWISKEEIDAFEEETVKDFKNTLQLAFEKMEELHGK